MTAGLTIDSVRIDRVLVPSSVEELSSAMESETGAVAIIGAGTEMEYGNPLRAADCAVDTRRLSRITEYVPGDLTVHVEAGARLGDLQSALAEHKQMLPLDPWNGPDATIGGIVATNAQGPLRAVGSVRDWIIGMKVVQIDGKISRTGGRVVKNVSGYDLAKLYAGSLGSLAVVSEVSFKLRAAYQATATAQARVSSTAQAASIIRELRAGEFDPISMVWTGPRNTILVRFGEQRRAVEWQLSRLPAADWEQFAEGNEGGVWDEVRDAYRSLGPIVVRVTSLPSKLPEIVDRFAPEAWLAHAATGVLFMALSDEEQVHLVRSHLRAVIDRAPLDVRRRTPTFGIRGGEYRLMRRLKDAFDPDGRLNPGRHVDGEEPD